MGEWQSLQQSILVGLIFSYVLAKVISIVVSFNEDNLTITRAATATATVTATATATRAEPDDAKNEDVVSDATRPFEEESVMAEQGSVRNESLDDDYDDDWEGVETTELDEAFSAAPAFVAAAAAAADRLSQKVSSDVQLQLYGLYKIATEGPCSTLQPSPLKMTARAKWQAWQKLGAMPPEEAMQKYIDIVTELYPSWLDGSSMRNKSGDGGHLGPEAKGAMGPAFSTFVYEEEYGSDSMRSKEEKSISVLEEEIFHKFRDFMIGIIKIEELGIAGNKLLSGFQQALEYIRKPPIDTNSKLINKIIEANETKRVITYVNSGCRKLNDSVHSVTNLRSCKHGLLNHISKAKEILNELEGLLGDVTSAIQSTHGNLSALSDLDFDVELNEQVENDALSHSHSPDVTTIKKKKNTPVTHLDGLMAIIHSMVKQDYLMQEKIVSALDPKLSSQELESYCQMWSLRPFINDEIVHQALQHIH
ncbi:hypothetical protein VNO77_03015 [Canavalia gladiata]|uniref:ACB domain-containing protein n=1 Tax=Canavalia gladiata TaxID=3824 RepID=A0AAN9R6F8_CANGL